MLNVHEMIVTYKRTTSNGICKFMGNNKERIAIHKSCMDNVELIEGQSYMLKIFQSTWESYLTLQIGAMKNIVSVEQL